MTDRLNEIRGRWANPRWDATAHHRADIAWLIAEGLTANTNRQKETA